MDLPGLTSEYTLPESLVTPSNIHIHPGMSRPCFESFLFP
jgi:hypothetical protein